MSDPHELGAKLKAILDERELQRRFEAWATGWAKAETIKLKKLTGEYPTACTQLPWKDILNKRETK